MVITREQAERVRDVVDAGLVSGLGNPFPGQMCVEAAVCFALGLPHGDQPSCVSPALRSLKIRLNDVTWSSDLARARGLRRLAVAQLGSAGALDERVFVRRVAEMTIRRVVPMALRAVARKGMPSQQATALEAAAMRCEQEGTRESARAAAAAASAAANAAANAAADAADANADAARDGVLAQFAEWVVEILIDMQAPGCQWLDLVPRWWQPQAPFAILARRN